MLFSWNLKELQANWEESMAELFFWALKRSCAVLKFSKAKRFS